MKYVIQTTTVHEFFDYDSFSNHLKSIGHEDLLRWVKIPNEYTIESLVRCIVPTLHLVKGIKTVYVDYFYKHLDFTTCDVMVMYRVGTLNMVLVQIY
jgi:hypothetical protein